MNPPSDDFFELLRQHEVILNKALTFSEMRAAIETPLHKLDSALRFETDLVDQIIADLQGQKEALPLLQFTLFELFEHRQGFLLTRQAYQEIHGVHGALATHAEKIYASFPKQQTAIHTLFLSLVKVSMGDDQEFIAARQSIDYTQLLQLDESAKGTNRVPIHKMIDAFIHARLLTANRQKNQRTLEISHEILLQAWPRLAGWIRKNGEALYKKNRATQDARNWQRNKRLSKDLYAGQQLQEIKKLVQQDFIGDDEPLRMFLQKSQAQQNRLYVARISAIFALLLIVSSAIYTIVLNYVLVPQNQIQVTNAQDDGSGSLRDALQKAKSGDTIVLDSSKIGKKTIKLQSDLNFAINDDHVTLQDNGVVLTAPAGQQLHIFPGIIITFNNLLIKNSRSAPSRAQGGVIFNQGQLTLISCNIFNNQSNYNGGALVHNAIQLNNSSSNILGQTQSLGSLSIVTNSNRVTIGYPPSNKNDPETLSNYAHTININLFCLTKGYSQGDPTPGDVTSITCISPLATAQGTSQTHPYFAVEACKDQLNIGSTPNVTSRLYDYYDLSTWKCYQNVQLVFSFAKDTLDDMSKKLSAFCQKTYKGAGLSNLPRQTAYDWQCENADGTLTGISMADACRFVTGNLNAFESLVNFTDPYGWECWAPSK